MKRVALYARVSTNKQTCENQLLELRQIAERSGYQIIGEYVDEGFSGAKGRIDRPALDAMLKLATQRKIDMILCWSIDRLGRSLRHLVEISNEMQTLRIDLFFLQQAIDTSTPSGKLFFSIFGALGEYERTLICDRVKAGLERAKSQGVKLGRPTKMNDSLKSAVLMLRAKNTPIKQIAAQLKIGVGTVYSVIEAANDSNVALAA